MPAHLLYGAVGLERLGHEVLYHHTRFTRYRWWLSLRTLWQVIRRARQCDVIYATTFRGLEILVFLRSFGLWPVPIVCWHHQPVVSSRQRWREWMARWFYRGFSELLFFSRPLLETSLRSDKAPRGHLHVVTWGADLPFYDKLLEETPLPALHTFVSTGKERRDMATLVAAFGAENLPLHIYICRSLLGDHYDQFFASLSLPSCVQVHFMEGDVVKALARRVRQSFCAVVCCQKTNYTVGLTTIVEALALGVPIVCSRNVTMPMNIEAEGCGLLVDYEDVEGWQRAIRYLAAHPEEAQQMGRRGRALAERLYNEQQLAKEVEVVLRKVVRQPLLDVMEKENL